MLAEWIGVPVEAQVGEAAAALWGITDRELEEIWRSLTEDTLAITGTFTAGGTPIATQLKGEVYGFNPAIGAFRSTPIT